jgi:hypothetical protein
MPPAITPTAGDIARKIVALRGHSSARCSAGGAVRRTTKRLNEQVRRNAERFPADFMFRLTRSEVEALNRSQIATSSQRHRDPRFLPLAFTEHGAIRAANVRPKAIEVGIYVVRAFLDLREMLADHDEAIAAILSAIRQLMNPPPSKRRPIGLPRSWTTRNSQPCGSCNS